MRWCYFLSLGGNGARDKWSFTEFRGPLQCQCTGRYKERVRCDRALLEELIDSLPSFGVNTVVIDLLDAVAYESHPEISLPGAFSREELRALLARMRAHGIEPVPKLNFSSCHDTWLKEYAWMKGTAKYYEVIKDLIDEVCEIFDRPKLFHLGMDEEDLSTHRKGLTIIRSNYLWCSDLYYYIDCVEKNGARPWIWGDYYWNHAKVFEQKIPRDCLISNWWYERLVTDGNGDFVPLMQMDTYVALSQLGYDQIPCASTWACDQNISQTVLFCQKKGILDEKLLGFMVAPWENVTDVSKYTLKNDLQHMKYAAEMLRK